MKEPKDFPFPLDVDIEEQVPVKKIVVDDIDEKKGSARFSVKTVMEKQTVRYMNVPKSKVRCKDGTHQFRPFNVKKGLFACLNCPYVRKIFPSTYRFDKESKQFIHRITGRAI